MTTSRSFGGPTPHSLNALAPERELSWQDYADLWLDFPLKRVLDYGCGSGTFLQRIVARGTQCTGVDIDPEAIAAAAPELRDRLVVVDPDRPLPFDGGSFDTVVMLEVVEHVRDERAVLRELARVLVPGGRLLLTTPHQGLLTFLDPGNFKFLLPRLHHFIHCTILRRKDYYDRRFGPARRTKLGMLADFTLDQNPWHRHYRYADICALAPADLHPVAGAVYFPGFRALWSLRLVLRVLTFGYVRRLPPPLRGVYRRLSRWRTRWGDQLVILFEKRATS